MPPRQPLNLITVRLDASILKLIDRLVDEQNANAPGAPRVFPPTTFTRSHMIRHAITTGLDVLTGAKPIKL